MITPEEGEAVLLSIAREICVEDRVPWEYANDERLSALADLGDQLRAKLRG